MVAPFLAPLHSPTLPLSLRRRPPTMQRRLILALFLCVTGAALARGQNDDGFCASAGQGVAGSWVPITQAIADTMPKHATVRQAGEHVPGLGHTRGGVGGTRPGVSCRPRPALHAPALLPAHPLLVPTGLYGQQPGRLPGRDVRQHVQHLGALLQRHHHLRGLRASRGRHELLAAPQRVVPRVRRRV